MGWILEPGQSTILHTLSAEGTIREVSSLPAGVSTRPALPADLAAGDELVLVRITEDAELDLELLRYLQEHGVEPGAALKVREATPFNALIVVDGPRGQVALGFPIATKLRVRRV